MIYCVIGLYIYVSIYVLNVYILSHLCRYILHIYIYRYILRDMCVDVIHSIYMCVVFNCLDKFVHLNLDSWIDDGWMYRQTYS